MSYGVGRNSTFKTLSLKKKNPAHARLFIAVTAQIAAQILIINTPKTIRNQLSTLLLRRTNELLI